MWQGPVWPVLVVGAGEVVEHDPGRYPVMGREVEYIAGVVIEPRDDLHVPARRAVGRAQGSPHRREPGCG